MIKFLKTKSAILFMLSFCIILLTSCNITQLSPTSPLPSGPPPVTIGPINENWAPPALNQSELSPDLSSIVAKIRPSVVAIDVNMTALNIFNRTITQPGAGSGWIIDPNGLIVTNTHVVANTTSIDVTLDDGRVFPAQQVASDAVSDIAIIKIDASGLPAATVGDSTKLKVGMRVLAMGNALGEGINMTSGYISRLGASITISDINETLYNLIETDTAINPGNSGGPLIDTNGEVIGITNAKLVATGVSGIGYAISTAVAMPVIEQLIQKGYVTRPYIGAAFQDNSPAIAFIRNLSVDYGAIITGITAGGPADQAGLEVGDVVVKLDGKDVNTANDAQQIIFNSEIGQSLTVTYYRDKVQHTTTVTLVKSPAPA